MRWNQKVSDFFCTILSQRGDTLEYIQPWTILHTCDYLLVCKTTQLLSDDRCNNHMCFLYSTASVFCLFIMHLFKMTKCIEQRIYINCVKLCDLKSKTVEQINEFLVVNLHMVYRFKSGIVISKRQKLSWEW